MTTPGSDGSGAHLLCKQNGPSDLRAVAPSVAAAHDSHVALREKCPAPVAVRHGLDTWFLRDHLGVVKVRNTLCRTGKQAAKGVPETNGTYFSRKCESQTPTFLLGHQAASAGSKDSSRRRLYRRGDVADLGPLGSSASGVLAD